MAAGVDSEQGEALGGSDAAGDGVEDGDGAEVVNAGGDEGFGAGAGFEEGVDGLVEAGETAGGDHGGRGFELAFAAGAFGDDEALAVARVSGRGRLGLLGNEKEHGVFGEGDVLDDFEDGPAAGLGAVRGGFGGDALKGLEEVFPALAQGV